MKKWHKGGLGRFLDCSVHQFISHCLIPLDLCIEFKLQFVQINYFSKKYRNELVNLYINSILKDFAGLTLAMLYSKFLLIN